MKKEQKHVHGSLNVLNGSGYELKLIRRHKGKREMRGQKEECREMDKKLVYTFKIRS